MGIDYDILMYIVLLRTVQDMRMFELNYPRFNSPFFIWK